MLSPDAKEIWKSAAGASLMAAMLGLKSADHGDQETAEALAELSRDDGDDDGESKLAADEAILEFRRAPDTRLAFDRASVRTKDVDGRLHVEITNISKAAVNPYLGREIPGCEELGLDPGRVYQLLRHPDELERGAATFNNLPLLNRHVIVSAIDPQKEQVIGSTGTDAVFTKPYLRNSLVVWDAQAIEAIESEDRRELSSAYRYVPVMEPGTYEGVRYDGVMTQIVGNHVALVAAGRAGPDVVVGDELPERNQEMKKPLSRHAVLAKGALLGSVTPMLAADAKLDLDSLLTGVNAANWAKKKAGIAHAIKPLLAKDANIGEVVQLLDKLSPDGSTADPVQDVPEAIDADPVEEVLAMLRGKLTDEDLAAVAAKLQAMSGGAAPPAAPGADATPAAGAPPVTEPSSGFPPPKKEDETPPSGAMDEAKVKVLIAEAEQRGRQSAQAIADAQTFVAPWVGTVVAQDSAEAVFGAALKILGVPTEGVHPSALKQILAAQPKPGSVGSPRRMAQDSAAADKLLAAVPGLANVRHV